MGLGPSAEARAPKFKNESAKIILQKRQKQSDVNPYIILRR